MRSFHWLYLMALCLASAALVMFIVAEFLITSSEVAFVAYLWPYVALTAAALGAVGRWRISAKRVELSV